MSILSRTQTDRTYNQRRDRSRVEVLYNPVTMVSLDIGFILLVLAICGLFLPNFLGLNLSAMHCWVLASCGALGIWSGLTPSRLRAMYINFGLGVFFLLNAALGFIVGEPGKERDLMNLRIPDDMVVKIAPGFLELSTYDHLLHSVVGVFFLIEAFSWLYRIRKL